MSLSCDSSVEVQTQRRNRNVFILDGPSVCSFFCGLERDHREPSNVFFPSGLFRNYFAIVESNRIAWSISMPLGTGGKFTFSNLASFISSNLLRVLST